MVTKEDVIKALENCYDPELGLSVVDLGFIYDVSINNDVVDIRMTVTVPTCPMRTLLLKEVEKAVKNIKGVRAVHVELVFDPPWTPEKMSEKAKKLLGIGKKAS